MLGGEEKALTRGPRLGKSPGRISEGWVGGMGRSVPSRRKGVRGGQGRRVGAVGNWSLSETPGAPGLEWGGQWSRGR